MGALGAMAVMTLAALPLIGFVTRGGTRPQKAAAGEGVWKAVRDAMSDKSYLLLHAVFFTCGFHIAFLVTHLPGEVDLCGLPPTVASWTLAIIGLANIFGSVVTGWGVGRYLSKHILFGMYASRALLILAFLA